MRSNEIFLIFAKSRIASIKDMTILRLELLAILIENRVDEIKRSNFSFQYIPSKYNPVDVATKELAPTGLKKNEMWWNDTTWLKENETNKPQWEFKENLENDEEECSSYSKINLIDGKRFTWIQPISTQKDQFTSYDYELAEWVLIKLAQSKGLTRDLSSTTNFWCHKPGNHRDVNQLKEETNWPQWEDNFEGNTKMKKETKSP
ncbi:hypothetical protein DINM_006710 [Dirofilaria immitis]|nr:hypothetical protein [Dirofilaria immitis]